MERDTKFKLSCFGILLKAKGPLDLCQMTIRVTKQGAAVCPGHGWRHLNTLPTPSAQETAPLPQHNSAYDQCTLGHPCARVLSKDHEIWAPHVTLGPRTSVLVFAAGCVESLGCESD